MAARAPAIELTGSVQDVTAPGAGVVAEWVVANFRDAPVVADFFLIVGLAQLLELTCSGARTQVGNHHARAVVLVGAGSESRIAVRVGSIRTRALLLRASAIADGEHVDLDLVARVEGHPDLLAALPDRRHARELVSA